MLNGVPEQYVQFKSTGIKLADKNGNIVETMPGSIAITGNVTVTGTLTAGFGTGDAVMLQPHTHGGGPPPDPGT
jgi:phage baseplate assembly protein gpV